MPSLYHFDIPIDNAGRAKQFYKDVFGLDMKKLNRSKFKGSNYGCVKQRMKMAEKVLPEE
ncbi:VOC family protein [Candidatus Nitrosocosmicus sp. T]